MDHSERHPLITAYTTPPRRSSDPNDTRPFVEIPLSNIRSRSRPPPPNVDAAAANEPTSDNCVEVPVASDDTLQGIAVRYSTTVALLKRLNQLSTEQDFHFLRSVKIPVTSYGGVITAQLLDFTSERRSPIDALRFETESQASSNSDSIPAPRHYLESKDRQIEQLRQNVESMRAADAPSAADGESFDAPLYRQGKTERAMSWRAICFFLVLVILLPLVIVLKLAKVI